MSRLTRFKFLLGNVILIPLISLFVNFAQAAVPVKILVPKPIQAGEAFEIKFSADASVSGDFTLSLVSHSMTEPKEFSVQISNGSGTLPMAGLDDGSYLLSLKQDGMDRPSAS